MTALDQALEKYIQDENQQADYYDLVLNTDFYLPIAQDDTDTPLKERDNVSPLIIETDHKSYLMLFDSEQRLTEWAKKPVEYVLLAGYAVAKFTPPGLHWAINTGSNPAKEFVPDEIAWLKKLSATEPEAPINT